MAAETCVDMIPLCFPPRPSLDIPAIAQLAEHLTVDLCSNQMVPGSIPGGRIAVPRRQEVLEARLHWARCA